MKTEATQQHSSSSGGGMSSTQPMRTSSTRSSVQHHDGIPSHTLDHATESMEEEGGYEGEDGEDDDEEGIPIGEQEEMLSETTVKSGYLYKRGEKRKNWKKRWFVLRSAKLYYYKNEKEYQLLRFIDMTEIHTIAPVELKKVENCFGISTSKRQYYVRATSAKEMLSWVDALRDVREQVRQRSTLTRDMALLDVGNVSSGGENQIPAHASAAPKNASQAANPTVKPIDQVGSPTGKQSTGSQPISIMIPGKGLYTAPAQSRITTGNTVLSPLSATSDSETGGPSGAEQFGLSYASSAGQSMASSPGRSGLFHHSGTVLHQQHQAQHTDYSSGGGHSPQSHSGGDEAAEMIRGKRGVQRGSGFREASVGSSTGEVAASGLTRRRSDSQQAGQPLSSSEDEGEGDDWDEEEEADLAMPLPNTGGMSLMSSFLHGHGSQGSSKQAQSSNSEPSSSVITTVSKPKVGPEFFKDSSKVIHQGYLMKQSNRRKHWRKRWFVLTSGSLSYTRSHMDAKPHRQIPLSSILDAIEYTSKKANQHSAPLSPSLGAFGGSNPLASFGRSPLLGGSGDSANASERRGSAQSKGATTSQNSNAGLVPSSEHELGAISANEAESGNERRGSSVNAAADPKQPATPAKKKKENCFKIITPKRVYIVCAPTEEEELKWLSALQALLTHFHEKDKNNAAASSHLNESSQEKQEQSITSPVQPGSPIQTSNASNRLNTPSSISHSSKPVRQGSQDDTRATAQEGVKAT